MSPAQARPADFRDRIAHHLLVKHLEPIGESVFIYDSFASRKGKGTHAAVERLTAFIPKVTANHIRRAWYAHLDVRSFFPSIDHAMLLEILRRRCPSPTLNWLCERIVRRDIRSDAILRGPADAFANVYLNELDQFIKHELGVRYHLRYVDDLVMLSHSRGDLLGSSAAIDTFLRRNLHLELNAKRSRVAPVSSGVDFLGYVVHPYHRLVRRRVVGNLRSRLSALEKRLTMEEAGISWVLYRQGESEYLRDMVASYRAHLLRADTRRLRASIRRRFPWLRWVLPERGKKPFWFAPRAFLCLGAQVHWFEERYPESLVAFQVARFWGIYGSWAARLAEAAHLTFYRGRRAGHRGWTRIPRERLDVLLRAARMTRSTDRPRPSEEGEPPKIGPSWVVGSGGGDDPRDAGHSTFDGSMLVWFAGTSRRIRTRLYERFEWDGEKAEANARNTEMR